MFNLTLSPVARSGFSIQVSYRHIAEAARMVGVEATEIRHLGRGQWTLGDGVTARSTQNGDIHIGGRIVQIVLPAEMYRLDGRGIQRRPEDPCFWS